MNASVIRAGPEAPQDDNTAAIENRKALTQSNFRILAAIAVSGCHKQYVGNAFVAVAGEKIARQLNIITTISVVVIP
jgi:hypothetical protein